MRVSARLTSPHVSCKHDTPLWRAWKLLSLFLGNPLTLHCTAAQQALAGPPRRSIFMILARFFGTFHAIFGRFCSPATSLGDRCHPGRVRGDLLTAGLGRSRGPRHALAPLSSAVVTTLLTTRAQCPEQWSIYHGPPVPLCPVQCSLYGCYSHPEPAIATFHRLLTRYR